MKLGKWIIRPQSYLTLHNITTEGGSYVCGGVAKEYEQLIALVPEMVDFFVNETDTKAQRLKKEKLLYLKIRQAMEQS